MTGGFLYEYRFQGEWFLSERFLGEDRGKIKIVGKACLVAVGA